MILPFLTEWFIINKKKERQDSNIARPRELKLEYGTIYLHNFKPEVANQLVEYIKRFSPSLECTTEVSTQATTEQISEPVSETTTLPFKAVGIATESNKTRVVVVGFNPSTNEAKIEKIQDCDGFRDASNKFKMAATEYNFV